MHEFKHKNIIEMYAAFHGEQTGLILELMEGGSLNDCEFFVILIFVIFVYLVFHQNHHIRYDACHVLGWAMQVTSALCYLHGHGYVHRDLKPSKYF